jgi:hypothetical protein
MLRIFIFFLTLSVFMLNADTLSESFWGYSFTNPDGWNYQKNSDAAILGHDTVAGLIVVYPHRLEDLAALRQEMLRGLDEDGIYLRLSGELTKTGSGYSGTYTGMYGGESVKAKGYATLSPYGGGAIVIALSTPSAYSGELQQAAASVVGSIRYKKESSTDLMQHFVGKWQTWSRYRESSVYLYPDGTYTDSSSVSYGNADAAAGATWGAAGDTHGRGHWRVRGNIREGELIFTDADGESGSYRYRVHTEGGETYWNEYYFGDTLYSRSSL